MEGTFGRVKTVNKAEHWSKHGKHKGVCVIATEQNRESKRRQQIREARKEKMYDSVQQAFEAARKGKR
jgi:hypothetical protein